MTTETMITGIVDCLRLSIYSKPDIDSEIVCKVRYLTEVEIDLDNSTDEFYKVYTAIGAEGFCLKKFITIK